MLIFRVIIAAGMLLLAACVPYARGPQPSSATYTGADDPLAKRDDVALQAAMQPGHAIVKGQAFSKTVGGDVKYGAGNNILILPASDYTRQCLELMKYTSAPCAVHLRPYTRVVQADGEGRFEVDDLAPGSYILTTVITWGVPGPYGVQMTGGPVTTIVEVKSDADVITANLN